MFRWRRLCKTWLLMVVCIVIGLVGCSVPDLSEPAPSAPSEAAASESVSIPFVQTARLGESIRLVGFDLGPPVIQPTGVLHLTLFWETDAPLSQNWVVIAKVTGPTGDVFVRNEAVPGDGARPTDTWRPGEIIVDEHRLVLDGSGPAGFYRVLIGMADSDDTAERLPIHVDDLRQEDDLLLLGRLIEVEP